MTMNKALTRSPHTFHIPVMGTGFSIDTPLKVARYGISSVISLVDDVLIEQMRQYHSAHHNIEFQPITKQTEDFRAKRITAYLDMLNDLIIQQSIDLKSSIFEPGSEISKYFELLPDSPLKKNYENMLSEIDIDKKHKMQTKLRDEIRSGSIDVNIMTKLDRDIYKNGEKLPPHNSDALSALRGYAKSSLISSIVFSAGMNRRLYGYLPEFDDFYPNENGYSKKKITLKVSDFRSAYIQGKFLAQKGLWVSEFRVESGLNCGGHAFPSQGSLMGPILDEFQKKKVELIDNLFGLYCNGLSQKGHSIPTAPPGLLITVQGGIGTAEEHSFLQNQYHVDGVGWGTPFLLVPEVVNMDKIHLERLKSSTDADLFLSNSSPLGVPFWNLRSSESEHVRRKRLEKNKPGSGCPKGYLVSNSEFTKIPICHASRIFQKRKIEEINNTVTDAKLKKILMSNVTDKSCICNDLAGSSTLTLGIDTKATPAVCCGPNITNFSEISTLEEMVNHIYGRISLLSNSQRPHMFIKELSLYIDHLQEEMRQSSEGLMNRTAKYFNEYKKNLQQGIEYYSKIAEQFNQEQIDKFNNELDRLIEEFDRICFDTVNPAIQ